jgi:nicotinate-nucleotide adenylyltransferase
VKIGIYGGSFDPVHLGHLLVAETVRDQLKLDQVLFIPAAQSPLKQGNIPTSAKNRVEMLRLAIGAHPAFEIDEREIQRGGISYTIETVRSLQSERPDATWFLLMGADSLRDFDKWKEPRELCRLTTPVVVARGGEPAPNLDRFAEFTDSERVEAIKHSTVTMPQLEISSRDIRRRVNEGRSIRYLVTAAVEAYIKNEGLYREAN